MGKLQTFSVGFYIALSVFAVVDHFPYLQGDREVKQAFQNHYTVTIMSITSTVFF